MRATRSTQVCAIRLPVSTEPVNATQSTRGSSTMRAPTSPPPGHEVDDARRERLEAVGERERRQRRQLRRLADARVARRQRRRELPREQQQRVVPRHDAGDDAHRLLEHERELRGLDRRDHAAREVAPQLGVVVERRGRPSRPRRRSRSRGLPPSRVIVSASSSVFARIRAATSCSSSARSPAGIAAHPREAARAAPIAASTCSSDGSATVAKTSPRAGSSTSSAPPVAVNQLACR